jgi:hypothetical protein
MVVTIKNGVVWDVTQCGPCKNRRFGRTYHHHQIRKIQRARCMLAAINNFSTLLRINHYMRMGDFEWNIFHQGRGFCRCVYLFPRIYNDRPLLRSGCYRTLLMSEVTAVTKDDMQGLGGS